MDQVTIWASLTDDTPRTVAALLADPRTDNDTGPTPATSPAPSVHSGPGPMMHWDFPKAGNFPVVRPRPAHHGTLRHHGAHCATALPGRNDPGLIHTACV
jgi:hypothetical protein